MAKIERNGFVYGSDNSKDIQFDKTVKNELSAENVQDAIDEINSSLYIAGDNKNITFGKNGDGDYGYYKADGSFSPFKSGEGGEPPVLLWTNPSTTMIAETVTLDLSEYAGVLIESQSYMGAGGSGSRLYVKKGERLSAGRNNTNNSSGGGARAVSVTDSGVTFEECYFAADKNNAAIVPTKIYGVKEYVVEPVSAVIPSKWVTGQVINCNVGDIICVAFTSSNSAYPTLISSGADSIEFYREGYKHFQICKATNNTVTFINGVCTSCVLSIK